MQEVELRQRFAPLITLYTRKVLNGEITIEQVPSLISGVTEDNLKNTEGLAQYYAERVLQNPLNMSDVPKVLIERVNALSDEIKMI